LPAALAGGLEAGGIEFVGDQGVGEVLTGRFELCIRLEVAEELLLAVGTYGLAITHISAGRLRRPGLDTGRRSW
jgi:hypothetical protein